MYTDPKSVSIFTFGHIFGGEKIAFARITRGITILFCATSSAWGSGFGICEGEGCTEPCPAENACRNDADCAEGMICNSNCVPSDCCFPSFCGCNPNTNQWGCTLDCHGECIPNPIPSASHWGLVIMTLFLLAAGTMVIGRRNMRRV